MMYFGPGSDRIYHSPAHHAQFAHYDMPLYVKSHLREECFGDTGKAIQGSLMSRRALAVTAPRIPPKPRTLRPCTAPCCPSDRRTGNAPCFHFVVTRVCRRSRTSTESSSKQRGLFKLLPASPHHRTSRGDWRRSSWADANGCLA